MGYFGVGFQKILCYLVFIVHQRVIHILPTEIKYLIFKLLYFFYIFVKQLPLGARVYLFLYIYPYYKFIALIIRAVMRFDGAPGKSLHLYNNFFLNQYFFIIKLSEKCKNDSTIVNC